MKKTRVENIFNTTLSFTFTFLLVISIISSFSLNIISITLLSEEYETSKLFINSLSELISPLNNLIDKVGQVIHMVPFIIICYIILLNMDNILTALKYISIAILTSGLALLISYNKLLNSMQIGNINIFTEINKICIILAVVGLMLTSILIVIDIKFGIRFVCRKGVK